MSIKTEIALDKILKESISLLLESEDLRKQVCNENKIKVILELALT